MCLPWQPKHCGRILWTLQTSCHPLTFATSRRRNVMGSIQGLLGSFWVHPAALRFYMCHTAVWISNHSNLQKTLIFSGFSHLFPVSHGSFHVISICRSPRHGSGVPRFQSPGARGLAPPRWPQRSAAPRPRAVIPGCSFFSLGTYHEVSKISI